MDVPGRGRLACACSYVLFRPDGTPVRATVKLTLTQVEKAVGKSSAGGA